MKRNHKTAVANRTNNLAMNSIIDKSDLPKSIIVVSDMEFDRQRGYYDYSNNTLMENIAMKWAQHGYQMPNLVYWNVQARQDNIPMTVKDGISYVSGFSPVLFEQIMKGKTAFDLMMDKLNDERYACIK